MPPPQPISRAVSPSSTAYLAGIACEMCLDLASYPGEADRIYGVQRPHRAIRVPPGCGHAFETRDLGGVDGRIHVDVVALASRGSKAAPAGEEGLAPAGWAPRADGRAAAARSRSMSPGALRSRRRPAGRDRMHRVVALSQPRRRCPSAGHELGARARSGGWSPGSTQARCPARGSWWVLEGEWCLRQGKLAPDARLEFRLSKSQYIMA